MDAIGLSPVTNALCRTNVPRETGVQLFARPFGSLEDLDPRAPARHSSEQVAWASLTPRGVSALRQWLRGATVRPRGASDRLWGRRGPAGRVLPARSSQARNQFHPRPWKASAEPIVAAILSFDKDVGSGLFKGSLLYLW